MGLGNGGWMDDETQGRAGTTLPAWRQKDVHYRPGQKPVELFQHCQHRADLVLQFPLVQM